MKTINKLLKYHFTEEELKKLYEAGIINWCWGKWWFNFDAFIKREINYLPKINKNKIKNLHKDIKELCYEHDFNFRFTYGYLAFIKTNFRLSFWIFKLIHWTNFMSRIFVFIILFSWLNWMWYKYFKNWKPKR